MNSNSHKNIRVPSYRFENILIGGDNQSASRTGEQIAHALATQLAPLLENKKKPSQWKAW
jgi:hypothetical protein